MNQSRSRKIVLPYKKQTNICVPLRRKSLKKHLKTIMEKGINTNKSFLNFIKPFLTNKGFIRSNGIILVMKKYLLAHLINATSILWR